MDLHDYHRHRHTDKVGIVMHEYKHNQLHSGSSHGPLVTNRRQAIAIALSEQRRYGRGAYLHTPRASRARR